MEEGLGTVTIAPGVLVTIARLTALSVPGVTRMGPGFGPKPKRLFRRRCASGEGVYVAVEDGMVIADVCVIVERDVNMLELARRVQAEVTRAIHDMVGMQVREVNVYIQDVEWGEQDDGEEGPG
jgi:uncharacterized alkaline shock family protein YloU